MSNGKTRTVSYKRSAQIIRQEKSGIRSELRDVILRKVIFTMKRSSSLYVRDIFNAIINIEQFTSRRSFQEFLKDEKTIHAVT